MQRLNRLNKILNKYFPKCSADNGTDLENQNISNENKIIKLEQYIELLFKWNRKFNLVSRNIRTNDIWEHILDSIFLASFIINKNGLIIDVGSGSGLPGLIVALLGFTNCHLVERSTKKSAFLIEAIANLNIKATVHNVDIRNIVFESFVSYIISKAVPLSLLMNCKNIINLGTAILTSSFDKSSFKTGSGRDSSSYHQSVQKKIEHKKHVVSDIAGQYDGFNTEIYENPYRDHSIITKFTKL